MLNKETRERFMNDMRGCSSGRLKIIRMILAQRVEILHAVGAPDDGSEEELEIIEEIASRKTRKKGRVSNGKHESNVPKTLWN